MPYASASQARSYYAGQNVSAISLRVAMDTAAGLVERYAPPPSPVPSDYVRKAANAELLVGDYLFSTGGFRTGDSLGEMSESYNLDGPLFRLISRSMGSYATGGPSSRMTIRRVARG